MPLPLGIVGAFCSEPVNRLVAHVPQSSVSESNRRIEAIRREVAPCDVGAETLITEIKMIETMLPSERLRDLHKGAQWNYPKTRKAQADLSLGKAIEAQTNEKDQITHLGHARMHLYCRYLTQIRFRNEQQTKFAKLRTAVLSHPPRNANEKRMKNEFMQLDNSGEEPEQRCQALLMTAAKRYVNLNKLSRDDLPELSVLREVIGSNAMKAWEEEEKDEYRRRTEWAFVVNKFCM